MSFVAQMEPWFDEHEARAVYDYMRSGGWVTEFRKTREFENAIAEYVGARYCSVVSNGTISLTLALMAFGVGPGDDVLVPDYTMVASANAVTLAGAEIVFVDVSLDTLCMDFDRMAEAVSPRTKAVMLVTINGRYPANLESFVDFCRQRELRLIEDAAQSLGSFKGERHLGRFGDIGSFSFSAPKVITTGQGGALVTDEEALIGQIRRLRDFGRDAGGGDHYLSRGWNFKFTDLQAVIGLEQMKKLEWRVARKKEIYDAYRRHLQGTTGVRFIPTNLSDTSPWFIDLLVDGGRRDELMAHLKQRGIGSRPFYPALHAEPVFGRQGDFPNAVTIARDGLWLPSSSSLDDETVERVCGEIQEFCLTEPKRPQHA